MKTPTVRPRFSPVRRLALLSAALVLVILSCTRDITSPDGGVQARVARGLSFQTAFPQAAGGTPLRDLVPFSTVHIVLHHSDGSLALDTLIAYPPGADSITVALTVKLLPTAPTTGEPLSLTLDYVNAQGVTVFHGGPVTVVAAPGLQATTPVTVPVAYTGPGASAVSVRIHPDTLTVFAGAPFAFLADALDAQGHALPGTPVAWSLLDGGATLDAVSAGTGLAGTVRGTVRVAATLLTGPADTALLIIQPRPSAMTAASGDGQTAAVGRALGKPVVVMVTATDGKGVSGVAVSFVAANGGSVDSATVTTRADGSASTHWTLGDSVGPQTLTATVAGLSGSPVTFHATATAGPAHGLAFNPGPPASVASGTPFGLTVLAHDSLGNLARSYADTITLVLGANPGADTLKGTLKAVADTGVATFTGLTLRKAAAGYSITASAPGLAGATSNTFSVTAGAVAACTLVSGGSQTAAASSALGPVVVQAADAAGNPAPNATLSAAVSSGGSLASGSPVTDASGKATISWTLGAAAGAQTLSVTCGTSVLVVSATATSVSTAKTWNGSGSTDWNTAANWTPSGVPASTDSVYVPSAPTNQPVLAGATAVRALALQLGASLNIGAQTLTVGGTLSALGDVIATTGLVQLTGSATINGKVLGPVTVTGTYSLLDDITVGGALTVGGSGTLTLAGSKAIVMGNFSTAGSGAVVMSSATDILDVRGNATFAGGTEAGKLTGGTLLVLGNFSQGGSPNAFTAAVAFVTRLLGVSTTVNFSSPNNSWFGRLELADSVSANFITNVAAQGDVWLQQYGAGTANSAPADTIFIGGNLLDSSGVRWHAGTTVMFGANTKVPRTVGGNLVFTASNALSDSLIVTGALTAKGSGTVLDLNGHWVSVGDSLATAAGGVLKMVSAADTFLVAGSASFNGGSTSGLLTNGYLEVAGPRFTQGTNAQAFVATGPHETYFADRGTAGATAHTITFANPGYSASHFGDFYVGDTLTHLGSDVYSDGELETGITIVHHVVGSGGDRLVVSRGADVRNLTFDNARWQLVDGDGVEEMNYVTFQGITNVTAPQFEWNRAGTGTRYDFVNWAFYSVPSGGGVYVKMTSSAPVDTIDLGHNGVLPMLSGGLTLAAGGAQIYWPNALTYTGGNHGSWNTFGNWNNSGTAMPDSTTDVIIPAGDSVTLSGNAYARNLTLAAGAGLAQGNYDLEVYGNLATDTLVGGITCGGTETTGITYQPEGPAATLQGRLCRYHSGRPITQTGLVTVSKIFHVHDGTYDFNGHKVVTDVAWVGAGANATGALLMTHPGDSLMVSDSMVVGANLGVTPSAGVSTLSAGVISVGGNFAVFGAPGAGYFNSQPAQTVWLTGYNRSIAFTDTTASAFGTLKVNDWYSLNSVARVAGNAFLLDTARLDGSAGRLRVAGNLYGMTGTSLTINALELAGTNADTGAFSPDTVVFTGAGQTIVDSLGAGIGNLNYRSIRVAGTATMAPYGASGSFFLNGKLMVSGGNLRIGNGTPLTVHVSDSLITTGSGTLQMVDDPTTTILDVAGNVLFAGGSTTGKLSGGTLKVGGNLSQWSTSSSTSFAPSGAQRTVLTGSGLQQVFFASPGSGAGGSHFATWTLINPDSTTGAALASAVFVDDTLRLQVSAANTARIAGGGHTLTAAGIYVPGGAGTRLMFDNTPLRFVDGNASATLDGLTFKNFGTSLAFDDARSDAITMNNPVWVGVAAGGNYLNKSGTGASLTLNSPTPTGTAWVLNTYYTITGGGTVIFN